MNINNTYYQGNREGLPEQAKNCIITKVVKNKHKTFIITKVVKNEQINLMKSKYRELTDEEKYI